MAVVILLYLVVEVVAIWAVSSAIGFLGALGLLLAGAIVGSWLARREGARAFRAFSDTARSGRSPHNEITDGMLIALGGIFIMIPGFVSDIIGFFFLLPPTRKGFRRFWLRKAEKQMHKRAVHHANQQRGPAMVVDSEVVDSSSAPQTSAQRTTIDNPDQPGKM